MNNNIINTILSYLPDELKTDYILNNLENQVEEYFNGTILGKIRVSEDLFNEVTSKYDNIEDNLEITSNQNNLIYMFIIGDKGALDFRIKKHEGDYKIVIGIVDNATNFKTTINYFKGLLISKVEIITTKSVNNMDVYYDYDLYFYDAHNKLIPRNK